jgi:hypothetical protein
VGETTRFVCAAVQDEPDQVSTDYRSVRTTPGPRDLFPWFAVINGQKASRRSVDV